MAWRFRKSIKVVPGVRLNISKSGISTTIGGRGASINVGKKGAYLNTGIPGTGFYNRKKISGLKENNLSKSSDNSNMSRTNKKKNLPIFMFWVIFIALNVIILSENPDIKFIFYIILGVAFFIFWITIFIGLGNSKTSVSASSLCQSSDERMDIEEIKPKEGKTEMDRPCINPLIEETIVDKVELTSIDPLFEEVARFVVESQMAAIHLFQRQFSIGNIRAEHIMEQLEMAQIVGPCLGPDYRDVKVSDIASLEKILSTITARKETPCVFDISIEYLDNVSQAVRTLVTFYSSLSEDSTIMEGIDKILPLYCGSKQEKLFVLFFCDCLKNYQKMGYDMSNFDNREGFAMVLLEFMIMDRKEQKFKIKYNELNNMAGQASYFKRLPQYAERMYKKNPGENFFFIVKVLAQCNRIDLIPRFYTTLYRLFSIISKVDNDVNETEMEWLTRLIAFSKEEANKDVKNSSDPFPEDGKNYEINNPVERKAKVGVEKISKIKLPKKQMDPIAELNNLIGLSNVKNEINDLSNFIKIQQMRESRGLKSSKLSYHCVFVGNPGTGKTTVARLVAEIYKQLGVLSKGHLIETDRSGLVAEYVGQTAAKTNAIIDKAIDGVLFIDEAYSLAQGGQNDYGKEAISTLLKRMEDDRDRLVVILAGYSKDMENFINSNPGLQSRFNRYIDFPDYSNEELIEIFKFVVKKNDCVATEDALVQVRKYIEKAKENNDSYLGNARFVRNLFERVITQQANRLASETKITNEMLSQIEVSDVENAMV